MKPRVGGFWHVAFCKRYALLPPPDHGPLPLNTNDIFYRVRKKFLHLWGKNRRRGSHVSSLGAVPSDGPQLEGQEDVRRSHSQQGT